MEELKAKEKRMEEYHKQNRIKKVSFPMIWNLRIIFQELKKEERKKEAQEKIEQIKEIERKFMESKKAERIKIKKKNEEL